MSDIHDKIRKLLAVAQGNANEHESARAMELASALMMRHGIDQASLGVDADQVTEGSIFEIDKKWQRTVARAAGLLYNARPFWNFDLKAFRYVGRPQNIDAAQDTMAFIVLQVEALYKAFLPKGLSKRERAEYRRSFKDACATRVYQRCLEIVERQKTDEGAVAVGCNALVVIAHRKQLDSEINDYLKEAGATTRKSRAVSVKLNEGYYAGNRAGDSVELNRSIEE